MRLAFLTNEYAGAGHAGGVGNYVQLIVGLLAKRGHQCDVFVSNLERAPYEVDDTLRAGGVTIHLLNEFADIPPALKDMSLWPGQRAKLCGAWRLAQALEKRHNSQSFDVVLTSNCGSVSLFVDIPVPIVMHLDSYTPMVADGHKTEQSLWRTTSEYLERATLWMSDALYARSRMLSEALHEALALPVQFLPPPAYLEVPPESSDTVWWREIAASSSPYFVFAGSLSRVKGLETLLEALPILFEACPDTHFHFVGREREGFDFWGECRRRFEGRVHYHGFVSHERVYRLIQNSIAIVIPSRIENAPNVAVEAMLLGTPIVGTQGISLEESIDGKHCAILIPKDDPVALAHAMIEFANMPAEQRDAMGKEGQQAIARVFDVQRSAALLEAFLEEAVRKGPRKRPSTTQRMLDLKVTLETFFSIESAIQKKIAAQSAVARQMTFQRDAAQRRMEQLKTEVEHQHTRIEQFNALMDARQTRIDQLRAEVENQHKRTEKFNALLVARQTRSEQLKAEADAKLKQLAQSRTQMDAWQGQIQACETQLNDQQTAIEVLGAELDAKQQEIAGLTTGLQFAERQAAELDEQIATLRNSVSYRLGNFFVRSVPGPIRRLLFSRKLSSM